MQIKSVVNKPGVRVAVSSPHRTRPRGGDVSVICTPVRRVGLCECAQFNLRTGHILMVIECFTFRRTYLILLGLIE